MENVQQFNQQILIHNIIKQRSPITGHSVYYVHVHKESQSGLLYNERMLVLEDKNFQLFYTKHIRPIDRLLQLQKKGIKPIKEVLSIVNTSAQLEDTIITIHFIKNNIRKNWIFKFSEERVTDKWFHLYKDLHQKSIANSMKSKSKDTASHSAREQEYASILSHNKYYQNLTEIKPETEAFQDSLKFQQRERKNRESQRHII